MYLNRDCIRIKDHREWINRGIRYFTSRVMNVFIFQSNPDNLSTLCTMRFSLPSQRTELSWEVVGKSLLDSEIWTKTRPVIFIFSRNFCRYRNKKVHHHNPNKSECIIMFNRSKVEWNLIPVVSFKTNFSFDFISFLR